MKWRCYTQNYYPKNFHSTLTINTKKGFHPQKYKQMSSHSHIYHAVYCVCTLYILEYIVIHSSPLSPRSSHWLCMCGRFTCKAHRRDSIFLCEDYFIIYNSYKISVSTATPKQSQLQPLDNILRHKLMQRRNEV